MVENDKKEELAKKLDNVKVNKSNFISLKKGSIEKDYVVGEVCGSGAFATVRKVVHKDTNQTRALKIVKKIKDSDTERMYLEVDILKTLVHPNIMQIFEFYEDKKNFYIICEQCEGGELFDQVVSKGSLTEIEAAKIMKQLLSAISYSHNNWIVHRDLKPENILLDTEKDDIIKIIDWGSARFFDKQKKMNKISGTPYYIAPEVLAGRYNEKCDIWSIGIVMYILLCGYPPYNGDNDNEIFENVKNGDFTFPDEEWEHISSEAKSLIKTILVKDYKVRPTAQECITHVWFEKTLKKEELNKNVSLKCFENMRKFRAEMKLQQAALTYMVNNLLSKEEKNELLQTFQALDKNGDGVLSKDEIIEGFGSIVGEVECKKEIERIMKEIDIDKNGFVDYNEFVIAAAEMQKVFNKEKLETTFKIFDQDGNGSITLDEIRAIFGEALNNNNKDVLEEIIRQVDENDDGVISLVEFKDMMIKFVE